MTYIGLDLSLTSTGICCLPEGWMADPRSCRVAVATHGMAPRNDWDRACRLRTMALTALSAALRVTSLERVVCWGIESLPTHNAHATVPLAELHGVVRYLLLRQNQRVITVPQSGARKLLLGKLPRKDTKAIVAATVRSFNGCASWGGDEIDAFVVANWIAWEFGERCLAGGQDG